MIQFMAAPTLFFIGNDGCRSLWQGCQRVYRHLPWNQPQSPFRSLHLSLLSFSASVAARSLLFTLAHCHSSTHSLWLACSLSISLFLSAGLGAGRAIYLPLSLSFSRSLTLSACFLTLSLSLSLWLVWGRWANAGAMCTLTNYQFARTLAASWGWFMWATMQN